MGRNYINSEEFREWLTRNDPDRVKVEAAATIAQLGVALTITPIEVLRISEASDQLAIERDWIADVNRIVDARKHDDENCRRNACVAQLPMGSPDFHPCFCCCHLTLREQQEREIADEAMRGLMQQRAEYAVRKARNRKLWLRVRIVLVWVACLGFAAWAVTR